MKLWVANILCDLSDKYGEDPKTILSKSSGAPSFIWVSKGELKARLWIADLQLTTYHRHHIEQNIFYSDGALAQRIIVRGKIMESECFDNHGNPLSLQEYEDYLDKNSRI